MTSLPLYPRRSGPLTRATQLLLIGACLNSAGAFDRFAAGATLEQLFAGSSITVANSQFSDWELISVDSTAAVTPDFAKITVLPLENDSANPGLQFAANGQLTVSGPKFMDLTFKFRILTLPGAKALTNHELSLTDIMFGGNSGLAFISDDMIDGSGADLEPAFVIADKASSFTQSLDTSAFTSQSSVSVTTHVFITGSSVADAINLASFTQRFAQNGPAFSAGDFDEDGDVDGADLVKWKAGVGVANATHLQGDADGDRDIDGTDFLAWQRQLVRPAVVEATASVPEPATLLLLISGLMSMSFRRRAAASQLTRPGCVHDRFGSPKDRECALVANCTLFACGGVHDSVHDRRVTL